MPEASGGLELRDVSVSFGRVPAVDRVSLSLGPGEILGIIGSSGSGKSTLLRAIDLLTPLAGGEIVFEGDVAVAVARSGRFFMRDIRSGRVSLMTADSACRIRRRVGLVFQGYSLWNDRTVLENLTLAPRVVLLEPAPDAAVRAKNLADLFGIGSKLDSRPSQLSGGERQRAAIVRTLLMRPRIILLDEVTSALDPVLTFEVIGAIRRLSESGYTMILVTHLLHFASAICDRIAFMSQGRVVQIDTPEGLWSSPVNEDVARFLTILESAR